eukprot:107449-Amorphochlora_amoeboformis.AAC.1
MEAFKKAGGLAFKKKDFKEAVIQFTKAIEIDSKNIALYSNRSVAYLKTGDIDKAVEDAEKCISIDPSWSKGYVRKGNALLGKDALREAKATFEEGLKQSPDANTKKQLDAGLRQVTAQSQRLQNELGGMFSKMFDNMWTKLAMNPETRPYLDEPDTKAKLEQLKNSPNPFGNQLLLKDQKIMKCLQVLLKANISGAQPGFGGPGPQDSEPKPAPEPAKAPEPEPEISAEEKKHKETKDAADAEKLKGNQLYKKKKFQEALQCYDKAIEIDPTNCMYLSNKASCYMEMKDFKQAVKLCEDSLKVGNEQKAAYKDKAKILTKMGKAYSKMKDYAMACDCYQRSLTEDYSDAADRLLRQTKAYMEKVAKKNYFDPEKAEDHMQKGREAAKEKKWREAIDEFSEALKRNPKEYKALSNRAFVYSKIMDWNNAVSDCEKCIAMAPDFLKIYSRRARIEIFLQRYHKALKAVNTAMKKGAKDKELQELLSLKQEILRKASMGGQPNNSRIEGLGDSWWVSRVVIRFSQNSLNNQ